MKIHSYQERAANQSKRLPGKIVDQPINLDVFNSIHKGKFLTTAPDTHERVRDGFRVYQCGDGTVLGVQI